MVQPIVFLTDNGSLRPDATFALRRLAGELSFRSGQRVEPVSLLHSHKIDPCALGGYPATIVKRRMRELLAEGHHDFFVLPLFLGPSLAITDYLPKIVEELSARHPDLHVRVAQTLVGSNVDQPDPRIAGILRKQTKPLIPEGGASTIALIDHGSPIRPVNQVRNAVARQLADLLGQRVAPCSMERREGDEYAFNEPLLERLFPSGFRSEQTLILAMFFLLPGRHAGRGGDVVEIADALVERGAIKRYRMTPLLGADPELIPILRDRMEAVLGAG